ncbi:hypothetical protein, partial [Granulicella mallensis]
TALHPQKQRLKNPLPSLQEQTRSGNTLFPQPVQPCRKSWATIQHHSAEGWSEGEAITTKLPSVEEPLLQKGMATDTPPSRTFSSEGEW